MSISANELRIGNWVQNDIGTTWKFKDHGELADYFNQEFPEPEAYPIPLIPEILEKAGFAEDLVDEQGWQKQFINDGNERWIIYNEYGLHISNVDFPIMTLNIHSLHQLQNLYHSLTGTELIIKL